MFSLLHIPRAAIDRALIAKLERENSELSSSFNNLCDLIQLLRCGKIFFLFFASHFFHFSKDFFHSLLHSRMHLRISRRYPSCGACATLRYDSAEVCCQCFTRVSTRCDWFRQYFQHIDAANVSDEPKNTTESEIWLEK